MPTGRPSWPPQVLHGFDPEFPDTSSPIPLLPPPHALLRTFIKFFGQTEELVYLTP